MSDPNKSVGRTFDAGGMAVKTGLFGGWVPVNPNGFAVPAAGGNIAIQPSNQPIAAFLNDVKTRGFLMNARAMRIRIPIGTTIAGAGTDARATEAQLGCCFALEAMAHPALHQSFTDRAYSLSQLRFEVANLLGGPRYSEHLRYTDPRATFGLPEEFAGVIDTVGGFTFGKGSYPGARGELSRDYKVSWSQTSLNTVAIQRAAVGAATSAIMLELTIPLCDHSGNPDNDALPLEAFVDPNNPMVFTLSHPINEIGTVFPVGAAQATLVAYGAMEIDFYCTYTKKGDPRPVGVPWQVRRITVANQTNFNVIALPYIAIVHSALYQASNPILADAPMTSVVYQPALYNGVDALQLEHYNNCGNRVWPSSSNALYGTFRQFLQGWNRVASEKARFPMIAEPVDMTPGTAVIGGVSNRWARVGSAIPGIRNYDPTDGRSLIFGLTADSMPFCPIAYNDLASTGFPMGFGNYRGTGDLQINLSGFTLPNNDPAGTSANFLTLCAAPDEKPGSQDSDRCTLANYAAFGRCSCVGQQRADATPIVDGPSAYVQNVAPIVPWAVKTDRYVG